jgi:hypothetical protein
VLVAGTILAACGTTSSAPPPDGMGTPSLNAGVTLSSVACEPLGWCIAVGSNPTATTAGASIEVSKGGRSGWHPVAVPPLTGVTLTAASCWSSGCLVGGTAPGGGVLLLVNPTRMVSSTHVSHPPGLGIAALDCTGAGKCLALVTTTTTTAVFETTDSAATWHQLSTLPDPLAVGTALSCSTAASCVTVGFGPGGAAAATTADGGRHWALASRPGGFQVLTSVGCGRTLQCLATARVTAGGMQLLRSVNGGRSWITIATSVTSPGAVECSTDPTCLVGGGGSSGGEISSIVALKHERPRSLAYVPDPVVSVACATPTRCVAVTQASTVSLVV